MEDNESAIGSAYNHLVESMSCKICKFQPHRLLLPGITTMAFRSLLMLGIPSPPFSLPLEKPDRPIHFISQQGLLFCPSVLTGFGFQPMHSVNWRNHSCSVHDQLKGIDHLTFFHTLPVLHILLHIHCPKPCQRCISLSS